MDVDVITIGGGLGGSTLATALARSGRSVLVLEREKKFKDRVRGENMLPWGVAAARRLGVLDDLTGRWRPSSALLQHVLHGHADRAPAAAGDDANAGRRASTCTTRICRRRCSLAAAKAGAEVKRGASVQVIAEQDGTLDGHVWRRRRDAVRHRPACRRRGRALLQDAANWAASACGAIPTTCASREHWCRARRCPTMAFTSVLGQGSRRSLRRSATSAHASTSSMSERWATGSSAAKPKSLSSSRGAARRSAPSAWFDGVERRRPAGRVRGRRPLGPVTEQAGLALIGDAAGATDPSWGCGLSKTLVDVETLASQLAETDDWNAALKRYAATHDDYFGKLHDILSWMTDLVWTGGPEADARRARVFPRMQQDPDGIPGCGRTRPFRSLRRTCAPPDPGRIMKYRRPR